MKDFMPQKNQDKKMLENVLAVSAKARKEKELNKDVINATSGSYYDDNGNIKVFGCVKETFEGGNFNSNLSYAGLRGSIGYSDVVKKWILGDDYENEYSDYLFSLIATPGGTGAISLTIGTYLEAGEGVMLPSIMWPAYLQIVKNQGVNTHTYELYNDDNRLNTDSILEVGKMLQEKYDKVVIVVNDPCHNPTGYTMDKTDYENLINVLNELSKKTKVVLLLDIAYLDYGKNTGKFTRENFKLLKNLSENVMILFAFSASKTFGIYGLRVGALLQMTKSEKEQQLFVDATSYFARSTWSNTTHFGMNIVENTLSNCCKKNSFVEELAEASENLASRAEVFVKELEKYDVPFAPYKSGFFVLILIDNKEFEQEIENHGAYGCHFASGYRIALSSINKYEAVRLAKIVGEAYLSVIKK